MSEGKSTRPYVDYIDEVTSGKIKGVPERVKQACKKLNEQKGHRGEIIATVLNARRTEGNAIDQIKGKIKMRKYSEYENAVLSIQRACKAHLEEQFSLHGEGK